MPVTLTQLRLQLIEQDCLIHNALCGEINADPHLQLASYSNQNFLRSICSEPLPDFSMQGGKSVAIGRPNGIETGAHCFANIFSPSSNHGFVQMGILPPDPTMRVFHREPDTHRQNLASLI